MALEFWTAAAGAGRRGAGALAAEVEAQGWDGISMVDSQNLTTDPYVFLALAAQATESLGLMTSVTNVVTRHAAVTASSALTVQQVSGGRFSLGIGRGDSALAHVGRAPSRLAWFEQYLANVSRYVRGQDVSMADLEMPDHIAPPVDNLGLADGPQTSTIGWARRVPPVPVEVAATGPKVIAAAARHSDRIIFALGADPARVAWGIETARQAAEAAGRDVDALSFGTYVTVVCADDLELARNVGRGSTSLFARFSAMDGTVASPADEAQTKVFEAVHDAYDMNHHARSTGAQTKVMPDEFLDVFSILGSEAHCIDRLGELAELGVTKFCVTGASSGSKDSAVAEAADRFIGNVVPAVRGS